MALPLYVLDLQDSIKRLSAESTTVRRVCGWLNWELNHIAESKEVLQDRASKYNIIEKQIEGLNGWTRSLKTLAVTVKEKAEEQGMELSPLDEQVIQCSYDTVAASDETINKSKELNRDLSGELVKMVSECLHTRLCTKEEEGKETCSICIENYKEGDRLMRLPCSHEMHETCLIDYTRTGKRLTCPICRAPYLQPN